MIERLKLTFLDKDGSYAIPEIVAVCSAVSSVGAALWDCFGRGHPLDLQGFGVGLGAIVLALGTAQRIRDGLWKDGQ